MATALDLARVKVSALLPVLLSLFVGELLLALVALELCGVERLHDKPVDLLVHFDSASAVRAGVPLLRPLGDARLAAQLIALLALLGVFDDAEADRAREVAVKILYSLFRLKLPIVLSR